MDERLSQEGIGDELSPSDLLDSIPETDSSESDASQSSGNHPLHLLSDELIVSESSSESEEVIDLERTQYGEYDVINETESSDSEGSQPPESRIAIDGDMFVPETPSPNDRGHEYTHSQGFQDEISIPIRNSPATSSDSSSQFLSASVQNSINDDEIIDETEPSESEGEQPENEVNSESRIPEIPSQSDHESSEIYSNQLENEQHQVPYLLSNSCSPTTSSRNSNVGSMLSINESDVIVPKTPNDSDESSFSPNLPDEDVIVSETEDDGSENSENGSANAQNSFGVEADTVASENNVPETSNHNSNQLGDQSPHVILPLVSEEVLRDPNHSTNLLDDDNRDMAEAETESVTEANSYDILSEIVQNEESDLDIVPPLIEDEFPFRITALPQHDDENEEAIPTEIQNVPEPGDEDDDVTILRGDNPRIEISPKSKVIVQRIERFVLDVVNDIREGNKIQILAQNRQNWSNCFLENERFMLLPISDARCRHIKSTFNLSLIFHVLGEIHEMLLTNKTCTVRELYYKDVNLTQKQENVNEALKTICCILDTTPWELGVLSTSKGLIAGPLQTHLPNNVVIDCSIDKNGITLPHLTAGIVDIRTTATYILLVEKDTVFKKLLQNNILECWNNVCILLTGKGYPDTNTRLILKKLRELHTLPINVLTDADPYGIEIMLTYRHGSMSMSNLAEALAVPSVRWLGIFPSDIRKFGIAAVPLTAEDKRILDNILNRPFINDHVHRELLIMKQTNLKAEIEGISNSNCTYLIDVYLRNKIDNNDGI